MTKRPLPPSLFVVSTILLSACPQENPGSDGPLRAFEDEWRTEISGPAAQIDKLVIGDRLTGDNFANRGDIEIRYEPGIDQITIEMQRFTAVTDQASADEAFERMHLWAYNIATPEAPDPAKADQACWAPDMSICYVRNYYDGAYQAVRDGVNFRVTIPEGWDGDLELTTEDNLGAGIDTYPDRSDIIVDGLAGSLVVDMDSGNAQVRMDPNTQHYAGCSANDKCIDEGYAIGCGCDEPTSISIANKTGQSSNMTVDVGDASKWYTFVLDNRGTFSPSEEFVCTATIDCGPFADCEIEPDYAEIEYEERAEINYPGDPAIRGAGVRVSLVSESCATLTYADGPDDFDIGEFPEMKRGDLEVCVGCLDDL